jgi:hypothetical protein
MESLNEETLTKPKQKKDRSPAQQEATKRMLSALDEKKLKLKVLKDKLNNAPPIPEPESEPESEEEEVVVPKKPVKAEKAVSKSVEAVVSKAAKPKKEPKVIYESASESEEEVVIVKKKKKPKKKTIIYEESEESEEEEVQPPKARETKTQKNKSSFKISAPEVKPAKPSPLYYFAD